MDKQALIAYFIGVVAWSVAPGPAMAVVVARSLGADARGAWMFATGLCLGFLLLAGAVAAGLGGLARSEPQWFAVAKYAGVGYLLWLALRLWKDSAVVTRCQPRGPRGWLGCLGAGTAVALGNPGTVLVYLLLVPTVAPEGFADPAQLALVLLVTLAAVGLVFFGTALLAARVQRLITTPASAGTMNRASAAMIALTSVWMLAA